MKIVSQKVSAERLLVDKLRKRLPWLPRQDDAMAEAVAVVLWAASQFSDLELEKSLTLGGMVANLCEQSPAVSAAHRAVIAANGSIADALTTTLASGPLVGQVIPRPRPEVIVCPVTPGAAPFVATIEDAERALDSGDVDAAIAALPRQNLTIEDLTASAAAVGLLPLCLAVDRDRGDWVLRRDP